MALDETDKKILDALYWDSDRSRKIIAREISISEPNLSKRIAVLEAEKVLANFTVNIDYDKTGFNTSSVTLIQMHDQHKESVCGNGGRYRD